MRVILTKTDDELGLIGTVVEVKDGFARNWLLPQGLAVLEGDPKAKEIRENAKKEKEKVVKEIEKLKEVAKEAELKTIEIKVKAGENGKIFGSVGADIIAKELKLDKKQLDFEPIKEIGVHEVLIKFGHGVTAKVKIDVSADKGTKSKDK
jgi:large subunit ribosomal protein L9